MIARYYNLSVSPETIYLAEAMKVEGYWSTKNFVLSIQNKNLPFLKHIETIVKKLKMPIYKRILLKVKVKENTKKENIKLLNKDKSLNFFIEKSPFGDSIKIVTSLPYKKNYNLSLIIDRDLFSVDIKVKKEEIAVESELNGWAYLDLRFPNKVMLSFLDKYAYKNKEPLLGDFLKNASKEYIISAFSALIDSEGSVDYYKLIRKIRIRMRSKIYLIEWKNLLAKYHIDARVRQNNDREYELCLEGWEDFDRLNKLGLNLYHSKRKRKFDYILSSYKRKQISRNTALEFYTKKLKEINKPVAAQEFAEFLGKSKRVTNHYLKKLEKRNMLNIDKSKITWLYSIK